MRRTYSYAILGAIIAISAGLFGAYGLDSFSTSSNLSTSANMLGHVTLLKHDTDGNVIDYRQFDNLITNTGETCVAVLLFGVTPSSNCTGALTAGEYAFIAIGNQSDSSGGGPGGPFAAASPIQNRLINELSAGELAREDARSLGPNGGGSVVFTTEPTTAGDALGAIVTLTQVFNNTNAGGVNTDINESGIFNGTGISDAGMFARQTFNNVTLADGESLTVEWTIQIGGTGSIGTGEET